jgi:hypothetical protein
MDYQEITKELSSNKTIFRQMLSGLHEDMILWRPLPEKWCMLEIICHLYDEEREDFRARTKQVLENPGLQLPQFDPQAWVESRRYMEQDYQAKLNDFLEERTQSVEWLQNLADPDWNNAYDHPKIGKMTAWMFLSNWLAHDYLHIRQVMKLKFEYLKIKANEDLTYAGSW